MSALVWELILWGSVLLFAIIGLFRGFFKSLLSLCGVVVTFVVAYFFAGPMVDILEKLFGLRTTLSGTFGETAGYYVCFFIGIIATYIIIRIIVFLLNHTIGKLFTLGALGTFNKALGFLFGLCQGFVFLCAMLVGVYLLAPIESVKTYVEPRMEQTIVITHLYNWLGTQVEGYLHPVEDTADDAVEETEEEGEIPV